MNSTEINCLNKAAEYGLIDLDSICSDVEMYENKRILRDHPFAVWQGKNGKWYTRVQTESGDKKLIKRNTRTDLDNYIIRHYKGDFKPRTVETIFYDWIEQKMRYNEICKGTYDRYVNDFKRYFKDIKNCGMADIDECFLEDFVKGKIAEFGLTSKSYGNMRTLLYGIFKYAKKYGYTYLSISAFFGDLDLSRRVFRHNKKSSREQVFTDDEARILIAWLKDHPSVEHYGIILAFYTGIREGELSGLKFSDVDGFRLHVQRQEIRYKSKEDHKVVHEVVEYTKSEAGDRIVFLTKEAIDIIAKIREMNPDNELMMMSGKRKFITTTFNHRLYRACDECGIPRRSMHKIRKTYGTKLIDNHVEDSIVMSQMGHSDITTTRKYYYFCNADEDYKAKQIEKAIVF